MKKMSKTFIALFLSAASLATSSYAYGQTAIESISESGVLSNLAVALGFWGILLVAISATVILVAIVIAVLAVKNRKNRCPFCKEQMKILGYETTRITRNAKLRSTIYTCPGCGHTCTKTHKINELADTEENIHQPKNGYSIPKAHRTRKSSR